MERLASTVLSYFPRVRIQSFGDKLGNEQVEETCANCILIAACVELPKAAYSKAEIGWGICKWKRLAPPYSCYPMRWDSKFGDKLGDKQVEKTCANCNLITTCVGKG